MESGEIRNDDSVNVNIEANLVVIEDDSKNPTDKVITGVSNLHVTCYT